MMPVVVGGPSRDPARVRAMFDDIARGYDLANSVMTLGLDHGWRRRAAREAVGGTRAAHVLDCACGTGKLASALVREGAFEVVGLDFSERMIAVARRRHPAVRFVVGDVMELPFAAGRFDAVTIGFGLRNLSEPLAGLRAMAHVVRPGGRVVVLEAVRAEGPRAPALRALAAAGPAVAGRLLRRASAYGYLRDTVRTYATSSEVARWLDDAGLGNVRARHLGFGAVALISGERPSGAE
jgi:demethylmenaquinone methyltransferase/2-methoxy-6-polyprenyl-1,4-benzoquinol methylase